MANNITEELKQLLSKLKKATFTGVGTSKWYPAGSQDAYYRMEYSPGKLVVRHKSLSEPDKEYRYKVWFRDINDLNFSSVEIYSGEKFFRKYSEKELNINEDINDANAYEVMRDELMGLLNMSGFKDPRWLIEATETAEEITTDKPNTKNYLIKSWDTVRMDPLFGIKILVELRVENSELKSMLVRKFIGEKEIKSQNMDITFTYSE